MNILFIESDDQSNQAVGACGNKNKITPNIDQLAIEDVSLTNTYNMGSWAPAVCMESTYGSLKKSVIKYYQVTIFVFSVISKTLIK